MDLKKVHLMKLDDDIELKAVIDDLINKFMQFLKVNVFGNTVSRVIRNAYSEGLEDVEEQFDMNFIPNGQKITFLEKYTFDNIKGMNEDIAEKLRKELSQAMINNESISSIKKRVKDVMDVAEHRASMIARTEYVRAQNQGSLDGARQSGLKLKKRWDAHLDKRTSTVCRDLDGVTIPLDAKFKWKGEEFDAPPSHPNCFLKGTKITMIDGTKKPIEKVKVGDFVKTHLNNDKRVYSTIVNQSEEYFEIDVGTERRKKTLRVTGEHPVLTQRGWVLVKDLTINDYLVRTNE
jgi:SPP1 gp7 family putative phage head morphogenesis protein